MSCTELIEEIGNAPAPSTGKKGKKREWPFGSPVICLGWESRS